MSCGVVRCGGVQCSVVRCVMPSLSLCIYCRYHDTVNEEERCVCPSICSMCLGSVDCNSFHMYYMLALLPSPLLSPPPPTVAPVEYTKVVLPQKMLKLLISDYEVALETDAGQRGVVTEGEEEWEDDEDVNDIDMFSALLAGESRGVCADGACCLCMLKI